MIFELHQIQGKRGGGGEGEEQKLKRKSEKQDLGRKSSRKSPLEDKTWHGDNSKKGRGVEVIKEKEKE